MAQDITTHHCKYVRDKNKTKHVDTGALSADGSACTKIVGNFPERRLENDGLPLISERSVKALKVGDTVGFAQHARESNRYRPLAYAALTYAKMGMTTVEEVLKLSEMVADTSDTDVDKAEDTGDGQV